MVAVIRHLSAAIVSGNVIGSVTGIGTGNVIGSVNGSATGNEIVNAIDMEAVEEEEEEVEVEVAVVAVEAVALLHVRQQALVAIDAPPAAENVMRIVAQPALEVVVVVEQVEAALQHLSDDAVALPRRSAIPSQVNHAIGPWKAVPAVHATW